MNKSVEMEIAGKTLRIETGKIAKQAQGSVSVCYGDSIILATVCISREPREGVDFLPLTVEYREKAYAIGKIPGNFFRREGRPNEKEILSARQIDRPLRPLFPKGYSNEVQIFVTVLSSDQEHDADVLGVIGASAAIALSPLPFFETIGAIHVGRLYGEFVVNPTYAQLEESEMNVVVAGTKDSILMVEGAAKEVSDETFLDAIDFAKGYIKDICILQDRLVEELQIAKEPFSAPEPDPELIKVMDEEWKDRVLEILSNTDKNKRSEAFDSIKKDAVNALEERFVDQKNTIIGYLEEMQKMFMRKMILTEGRRLDMRGPDDIRDISSEIGILPRTHGSALFTRGQTQSLAVITLGTKINERMIDDLEGVSWKSYMLDYNFPPYSVGEVRMMRGTSRREVGHGNLAERALQPIIPPEEVFPYTIRIVSDILESNGSSSMATVCAGSLSLMDAGVPVKCNIAGIAMGLIKENEKAVILTDIIGDEDHYGDMDFKVSGSREGVTAVQMDIKIPGITSEILQEAMMKARHARIHILDILDQTIAVPRSELSQYAPRIITLSVRPDQIGAVIGTGGKVIRSIQEETGTTINIDDDGTVTIASVDAEQGERARKMVESLVEEAEVGKIYDGTVKRIMNFGAFIEILPGQEGLCHISELEHRRVERVEDVLKVGDTVSVKVIDIDDQGKIKLSRKANIERTGSDSESRPRYSKSTGDYHNNRKRQNSRPNRNR